MIYIQLIGILAFSILVLSFYKKDTRTILLYQITSSFSYFIHYLLLGALTGAYISFISIIRNIVFIKIKNKKVVVPIFISIYLLIVIVFYENVFTLLPAIANSIYIIFMSFDTKKHLIIAGIISMSLWLIYDIAVLSYASMITDSILIISNTILLIKEQKKYCVKQ